MIVAITVNAQRWWANASLTLVAPTKRELAQKIARAK